MQTIWKPLSLKNSSAWVFFSFLSLYLIHSFVCIRYKSSIEYGICYCIFHNNYLNLFIFTIVWIGERALLCVCVPLWFSYFVLFLIKRTEKTRLHLYDRLVRFFEHGCRSFWGKIHWCDRKQWNFRCNKIYSFTHSLSAIFLKIRCRCQAICFNESVKVGLSIWLYLLYFLSLFLCVLLIV